MGLVLGFCVQKNAELVNEEPKYKYRYYDQRIREEMKNVNFFNFLLKTKEKQGFEPWVQKIVR